jgi:lipopolysaccharide export system permease protein
MVHLLVQIMRSFYKKFHLYILKELSYILLLSLAILTFILVMNRLGKLTDLVINKGVELIDIVLLIIYSSPPFLTFTLPMAFLLSTIVTLGRLSTENEILALKASGVNLRCLFVPIASVGILITAIALFNTNLLLPTSANLFRDTLVNVLKKGITVDDKEGIFNDTIPGVVIYIDKVDPQSNKLTGVLVSDDRDKDEKQTISASNGFIHLDPVTLDLSFILYNGSLHKWEKKNDTYRTVSFKDYTFMINLANMLPPSAGVRKRPFEMDRKELRKAMGLANKDRQYDLQIEIYKKITIPMSALAFILLTVPLGIRRKVEGRFSGIIYSLVLFVFYYILMALTENLGKTLLIPPLLVVSIPNTTIVLLGLYLLRNLNVEEPTKTSQTIRFFWTRYLEKAK